jgi:carbamate kinase
MIVVDPHDPAFASPSKFVGPLYSEDDSGKLAASKGWTFRQDGSAWRRVVPSPEPRQILEIEPITWLLDREAVVICAGGGGIPTVYPSAGPGALAGVEAVIDKDLASELLAENVSADLFLMATDVDGVYLDWGTPQQRRLGQVTLEELAGHQFAAGSMGPKVEAARRFVARTGRRAAIGSLAHITGIVAGTVGTNVIARKAPDAARPGYSASG